MSRAIDRFVLWLCEGLLRLIGRHALANLVGRDSVEPLDEPWRRSSVKPEACICGDPSPPIWHTPDCPVGMIP